jgi:hypothetical protein
MTFFRLRNHSGAMPNRATLFLAVILVIAASLAAAAPSVLHEVKAARGVTLGVELGSESLLSLDLVARLSARRLNEFLPGAGHSVQLGAGSSLAGSLKLEERVTLTFPSAADNTVGMATAVSYAHQLGVKVALDVEVSARIVNAGGRIAVEVPDDGIKLSHRDAATSSTMMTMAVNAVLAVAKSPISRFVSLAINEALAKHVRELQLKNLVLDDVTARLLPMINGALPQALQFSEARALALLEKIVGDPRIVTEAANGGAITVRFPLHPLRVFS